MATPNDGTRSPLSGLREKLKENQRLVARSRVILSQIDQEFASLKDKKAQIRRRRLAASRTKPGAAETSTSGRRQILLIEDHPIVSRGMADLINYESDVQVAGMAEDSSEGISQIDELQPDLVIMDLSLKEKSGLEVLKEIRRQFPDQRVLILSLHDEAVYAPRALRAGACGYVMKEAATDTLLEAIRKVLAGGVYLSPALRQPGNGLAPSHPLQALSDRELDVLRLIGYGKTSQEIAQMLAVNVRTVESHRTHIRHKLELKNATGLVQLAIELHQNPRHLAPSPP